MLGSDIAIALVVLELIAIGLVWHAARHARTPQGAMGWGVFLIAAPYLAVPLYAFLGHHRVRGYQLARRDSEELMEEIRQFGLAHARPAETTPDAPPFEAIAGFKAVGGNAAELLIDGDAAFDAILKAIDGAERYVLVQFYIIRDDGLGRRLRDTLVAAAERGVAVNLMFDAVGSAQLPESYIETLRKAGARVMDRKTSRGPRAFFQINYRNHRKTVIVDGRIGFTGGLNVGDEYLGLSEEFGPWRDTHVQLAGPMVTQLQLIYAEDWHWATRERSFIDELDWQAVEHPMDMTGLIVATGPGDTMDTGEMLFIAAIAAARDRVWIASPYFVPDGGSLKALKLAALRGVDVRLLVPDVIDHKIPWLAAFAYFDEIREAGVEVWRYTEGFMHQKAFVVDDRIAAVGTTNMDNRSFRLNFEAMAVIFDARAARDVAEMFAGDFERSFKLDKTMAEQKRQIRAFAPIARLFSPLL